MIHCEAFDETIDQEFGACDCAFCASDETVLSTILYNIPIQIGFWGEVFNDL